MTHHSPGGSTRCGQRTLYRPSIRKRGRTYFLVTTVVQIKFTVRTNRPYPFPGQPYTTLQPTCHPYGAKNSKSPLSNQNTDVCTSCIFPVIIYSSLFTKTVEKKNNTKTIKREGKATIITIITSGENFFLSKTASPFCHPSRRRMDSSNLDSHLIAYVFLGPT